LHKPDKTLPGHYASVELPPRTWRDKAKAVPLSVWRGLGKIPVFADILGIFVALGIGVISVEEYAGSLVLITFAAIALTSNLWHRRDYPFLAKCAETIAIVFMLLVLTLIIWDVKGDKDWSHLPHAWARLTGQLKKEKVAIKQEDEPTILVRYSQQKLPIPIEAKSSILVLPLTPYIQDQTVEVRNDKSHSIQWPEERRHGHEPEAVYACELSNHSDKAILDVTMIFDLKFISAVPTPAIGKRVNGIDSVTVQMDTTRKDDPMSFGFFDDKNRVIAAATGGLVREQKHPVTIPVISARGSVTVYLVSQSSMFTQFSLPNTATLIVDGNPAYRVGALIRPAMSTPDRIPKWGLPPSLYEWPHIPESALNFDDFVAKPIAKPPDPKLPSASYTQRAPLRAS
jgi:hypothetical protein